MKIAIVHDYLVQDGGAERVLEALHTIWPEAPIFVLFYESNNFPQFQKADIRPSFLKHVPFVTKKYRWLLPIMPIATEKYDLSDFDLVISSTSAFAKGVITNPKTLHISYCHTPTRYLWTDTHDYINNLRTNMFVRMLLPRLIHKLRLWDKMSADRVDHFIANSQTVQNRIKKYYRKPSTIIHPPIKLSDFGIAKTIDNYFVTGGRLVPYKRFDIVIQACNRLQIPLKIFGDGPERKHLERMSKSNITFLGRISDQKKAEVLSHAKAFIHPQEEDFGITPIESMASGRPVIAYGRGGATETIIDGKTGILFHKQTWASLLDVLMNFNEHDWDSGEIRAWTMQYSFEQFSDSLTQFVSQEMQTFNADTQACRLDVSSVAPKQYEHFD